MSSQKKTIAVLDSGVGGLSIFQSIKEALPQVSIVYACDNKNFPYGTKSADTVVGCIQSMTQRVIERYSPQLIVIACNTASTIALESLRSTFSVPMVGVVPAIKPAAAQSRSKTIGLLATPGTIQRPYTDQLIEEYAKDCKVIKVGSSRLVELAEEKLRGLPIKLDEIKTEIAPFFSEDYRDAIDTIVLGCTHFPLLSTELTLASPKKVTWLDSSQAIAQRVTSLVKQPGASSPIYTPTFTLLNESVLSLRPHLKTLGFAELEEL
jgi:glutamate racemase